MLAARNTSHPEGEASCLQALHLLLATDSAQAEALVRGLLALGTLGQTDRALRDLATTTLPNLQAMLHGLSGHADARVQQTARSVAALFSAP